MWNERYSVDDYIYGTTPNTFLAENANMLKGSVLSLAEGEGRNGVFLATLGLDVHGVDGSDVALLKAQKLAQAKGVTIQTEVADLEYFQPKQNYYNSVISIFAHLPSSIRNKLYPLVVKSLLPGGIIILEAYSESQLSRNTGGPKEPDMLMTKLKIEQEFSGLEVILLHEIVRQVHEGTYHTGEASVVQFIGRKI